MELDLRNLQGDLYRTKTKAQVLSAFFIEQGNDSRVFDRDELSGIGSIIEDIEKDLMDIFTQLKDYILFTEN